MPKRDNPFNLNISRKNERNLDGRLIDEMINIYGIPCLWLYSERVNEDLVFKDFSHFRIDKDYKQVTLLPEDTDNWEGDIAYNQFGLYQQYHMHLYISTQDMLYLYPDFLTEDGARANVVNSLIQLPSGTLVEVTRVESFDQGISNQYAYADYPNVYKLTCKVYSNNLPDEGIQDAKNDVKLEEGPLDSTENGRIFDHTENIDTKDIDKFFKKLEINKTKIDKEGDKISETDNPFGTLG